MCGVDNCYFWAGLCMYILRAFSNWWWLLPPRVGRINCPKDCRHGHSFESSFRGEIAFSKFFAINPQSNLHCNIVAFVQEFQLIATIRVMYKTYVNLFDEVTSFSLEKKKWKAAMSLTSSLPELYLHAHYQLRSFLRFCRFLGFIFNNLFCF
jgi:hypothetical protein